MTFNQKLKNLAFNYSLVVGIFFVYFFVVGILTLLFPEIGLQNLEETKLQDMLKDNPLKFFFLAVVFAPIIEEGLYRTLVKPKPYELCLLLSVLLVSFGFRFVPDDVVWWLKFLIGFLTLFIVFKVLEELIPQAILQKTCDVLGRYTIPIIIVSSILFGFAHVSNYVDEFVVTWPIFVAIVPRIILGFMFCKVKIENDGIGWAMGLHAINNGIVFLIGYLTMDLLPVEGLF